jgi:hypothetical protein
MLIRKLPYKSELFCLINSNKVWQISPNRNTWKWYPKSWSYSRVPWKKMIVDFVSKLCFSGSMVLRRFSSCKNCSPSVAPQILGGKLVDWFLFYVPLKNFHLYGDVPITGEGMVNLGLWAGRDLYRATPAVTRGLGFSCLIRRTATFSRLLRHTRGCDGSILTRILTSESFLSNWLLTILEWPYPIFAF